MPPLASGFSGVALTVAVAGVICVAFGVPRPGTWLTWAVLVLVLLLRARDARFWSGLSTSLAVMTALGLLLLALTALRIEADNGALFDGVARLTQLGGIHANPGYPPWWLPTFAVAVLRYGLPMGLSLTLSWIVATGPGIPRIERAALVLAMLKFAVLFFEGPMLSLIYLVAGAFAGMALWRTIPGLVVAILIFVIIGSGGLNGAISGSRAASGLANVGRNAEAMALTAYTLFAALTSNPQDRDLDNRPLPVFLAESAKRGVRKLRWFAIVMSLPVALVACGTVFGPSFTATDVEVEHVHREIPLNAVVISGYHSSGSEIWLHRADNGLLRADVATGRVHPGPVSATALAIAEGKVMALVPGSPGRIVVLDGERTEDVVSLPDGVTGVFAIDGNAIYVGASDGTLTKLDRGTGRQVARIDSRAPVRRIMAREGQIWTLHPPKNEYDGSYRAVRRDGTTLKETGEQPQPLLLYDLLVPERGAMWIAGPTAGEYIPDLNWADHQPSAGDLPDDSVLFPGNGDTAWVTYPPGRVVQLQPSSSARLYFHYRLISGIFETDHGTWLVVRRYESVVGPHRSDTNSLLVHWDRG
nr:PQQ-binding-like beta-propeller repeat protein [Micromonospora sp. DSM 115978]